MAQECLPGPHQRADRGGAHAGKGFLVHRFLEMKRLALMRARF